MIGEFRGLTKAGKWVYGDLIHQNDRIFIYPKGARPDLSIDKWLVEVIGETVGQFTGELDKNNKEIWIGDIYTYQQPLVKAGRQIYKEHRILVKDDIVELYYLSNRADSGQGIEIIGDIHTSPELMGENKPCCDSPSEEKCAQCQEIGLANPHNH